uniref:Methyltransferase FkbM domain-containing protein n=1 Tax=viral metagenome TaxID=1070528 RepID=A0A6C0H3Z7_9ZZZZ
MNKFIYPNCSVIEITDETMEINKNHWFGREKMVHESNSIDYVYKKLSEIIKANGKARLIDIGAQEGLYSLYAKYFDNIRVDAYEPYISSHKCLVDNIAINNVKDKVFAYNFAISNIKGLATLKVSKTNPSIKTLGDSPIRFKEYDEEEVFTEKLDNLYAVRKVDFIRCSAEGAEYFILQGGAEILKRDKPELLLTVDESAMSECSVTTERFFKLLRSLGYKSVGIVDFDNMAFSTK